MAVIDWNRCERCGMREGEWSHYDKLDCNLGIKDMEFTIEKVEVTAKSRALKAEWTVELDPMQHWHSEIPQSLKASYGDYGMDNTVFNCGLVINNENADKDVYKFSEPQILGELFDYIASTYSAHYSSPEDNVQALDLIAATGHAYSFCVGAILKYASRVGKKKGQERADILKILHFAVFLLHFHDKQEAKKVKEAK